MNVGSNTSTTKTQDQTEQTVFLTDNMPGTMNRVARAVIMRHKFIGWEAARLLALVNMSQADALIAVFDAAFFYSYWRPVTAIHEGDTESKYRG